MSANWKVYEMFALAKRKPYQTCIFWADSKMRAHNYHSYTPADIIWYTPGHTLEAHSAKTIHVHNSD